jgi:REP element-mobilizing transposase RayT
MNRGVKRLPLFHENRDREMFLRFLRQTQELYPFTLIRYCLMTNHYHLVLKMLEVSLSKIMQYFSGLYGAWYNRIYEQVGHVFQGRFHSIYVDTDAYLKVVCRYVDLNPSRAGIVRRPEDYHWSHYRSLVEDRPDVLCDPTLLLDQFGEPKDEQRARYRRFVDEAVGKPEYITDKILLKMRFWGNPPSSWNPTSKP